jgi:hypothetical protein
LDVLKSQIIHLPKILNFQNTIFFFIGVLVLERVIGTMLKFKITKALDSTTVYQDTFLRIIKDTFGDLNVEFYDSSLST